MTIQIVGTEGIVKWARAFAGGVDVTEDEEMLFEQAVDYLFNQTQNRVHVLSGDLKASGRERVWREGPAVFGEIEYGGGEVDYAWFEMRRGGSHDFMSPAVVATERLFGAALEEAVDSMMRRALGG